MASVVNLRLPTILSKENNMDKSTYIPNAPEVEAKPEPVEQVKAEASKILANYGFVEVESYESVRYSSRGE